MLEPPTAASRSRPWTPRSLHRAVLARRARDPFGRCGDRCVPARSCA